MNRIKSFEEDKAVCYLIATPIGNLKDISIRAKELLSSLKVLACEDTRTTSNLLHQLGLPIPELISYHQFNESKCSPKLIEYLLNGTSIGIVSDAGYPGISDPGRIIVDWCIERQIPVSVIPGGNALLPALIASGLENDHFYFHGFLDSNPSKRRKTLAQLSSYPFTMVFYESPHRIRETLNDFAKEYGDRKITICRELTKLHEEFIYGYVREFSESQGCDPSFYDSLKGELVLVVEGQNKEDTPIDEKECIEKIKLLMEQENLSLKEACKEFALKNNLRKNYLYELMLKNKE